MNHQQHPPDEQPAIGVGSLRQRLIEAREVARRLTVASPGERQLRGLVMEIVTMLVGDGEPMHDDLRNSGALFAAPSVGTPMGSVGPAVRYHVQNPAQPPPAARAPTLPAPSRMPAQTRAGSASPAFHRPASTRPLSIEEAARGLVAQPAPIEVPPTETEAPAPIPIRATTHDGQPDPEGDQFLASLNDQLSQEEKGG